MKGVSSVQVEKLMQIADYLREEREKRSISLEEIAIKTFIPLRLLQALDEGQVERLPEPVFVQGFIRRYADALGLDGMALARTFPVEAPPEPKPLESEPASVVPSVEELPKDPVAVTPPSFNRSEVKGSRFLLPYALLGSAAVILLAVGGFALLNRSGFTNDLQSSGKDAIAPNTVPSPEASIEPSTPPKSESQLKSSPSPAVTPTTSPTPLAQQSPSADSPVEVAIDLRDGDSWMEIVVDGKTEFEGTLKKGTQKTWSAQKRLVLISGNAGAVYVTYNQGEEKKLGTPGEVKEMSFPPKSSISSN